jgi:hypothetical protein
MSQFQNNQRLSPQGPQGIEALDVQVYQEGKTILPDTKIGVGYSGINMTAVAQSALQVGSELYAGYKENQVAEKEALLKKEAQDMSDRLDIYTIKNDWKSAEAEKPAHQARVKEILGYDPNEKASSRLGSMALSMSASYNAKVAVGSLQEKDIVENTAIVAYTNRMKSDIANAKTIAERDRLTDEMERFSRQELVRLGYTSSVNTDKSQVYGGMLMVALNNPDITAESLTGRSAVERDRILKLQDLLLTSQDARTKHLASDSKAEAEYQEKLKKASLFDIYATLSGSEQVGQGVTKQISELETLLAQKANEGGNIANDEYLKLRAKTLSNIYQMQNTVNGTIQRLLTQAGVTNPKEFITDDGNFNYLEVIPFLTRAMGEDGKEIITKLGNMTAMIDAGKTGVLSREARTMDSLIAKEYKQRETNVKLLRVSYDTAISAINSSTAPEFDKNRARLATLANLEQNIMKEFEYLNPEWKAASQERSRLTSPDPRIPQQAGGRIRELLQRGSDIPGLELDAFVNATAQFDSRGLKQPNYAAAAFAQAYELYNEAQRKAFPEGTSSASKAQAAKEAELSSEYIAWSTGEMSGGKQSVSAERTGEVVAYNATLNYGYQHGMTPNDFISSLKERQRKDPQAQKIPTRDLMALYPEIVDFAKLTGDPEFMAAKEESRSLVAGLTSQPGDSHSNRASSVTTHVAKETSNALVKVLEEGAENGAALDVSYLGTIILAHSPQERAELILALKSSKMYDNPIYKNNVDALAISSETFVAGADTMAHMKTVKSVSADDMQQLRNMQNALDRGKQSDDPSKVNTTAGAEVKAAAEMFAKLKPAMDDIFTKLNFTNALEPLTADEIENPNQAALKETLYGEFMKAVTTVTTFSDTAQTPQDILSSQEGWDKVRGVMQRSIEKKYSIIRGQTGPQLVAYIPDSPDQFSTIELDASVFTGAQAGLKVRGKETQLIAKSDSMSTALTQNDGDNYQLYLQFGTKATWDDLKLSTKAAFKAAPHHTAMAAQVAVSKIPKYGDDGLQDTSDRRADLGVLFDAAKGSGTDNGSIIAGIAALNAYKFTPGETIEQSQQGLTAMSREIKKAFNGKSREYFVEYRMEPGNAGEVNKQTLVVLSLDGKPLARMQVGPKTINDQAKVNLKGESEGWLQEAMRRDTKEMVSAGIPYNDERNGNDAVIIQWFADNPDKDTVSLRRKGKAPVFSLDLPEWMGRGFVAETWRGETTHTYKRGVDHDNYNQEVVLDVTHTPENSMFYDHLKFRNKKTKFPVLGILSEAKPTFYPSPNVKAMSGPSIFTDPLEGPTSTYPTREEAETSFDELPPDVQKYIDEFQKFGGPNFNSPLQAPPINGVATDRVYDNTNSQADFDRQMANWPTDAIDRELTDGKLRYPTDPRWLSDPSNFNSQMAPPPIGGVDRLDAYEVKDPGLGLPPPGPNDGAIFDTQMRNAARAVSADIINDMSGKINAVANAQKYVIDRASDFNNDVMDSAVNSFLGGVGPLRTPAPEEYLNFQKIAASTLNGLLQPSNVTLPLHILQVLREPRPTDAQLTELANYRNRQIARGSQSKPIELSYGASKPRMDTSPRPEPVWESVPPPDTNATIPRFIAEYFKDLSEDQLRELKAYGKLYPKDYFGPRTH